MSAILKMMMSSGFVLFLFCCVSASVSTGQEELNAASKGLHLITVASEPNDGFRRFAKSARQHKIPLQVLGMGKQWMGGDMNFAGGGYKINLLIEALEKVKDNKDLIVMFTDSYDVIITGNEAEIVKAFQKFDARIVFSAEGYCWPQHHLAELYPAVKGNEQRFLNSGGFIGYAPDLYRLITVNPVANTDDDQLYYTQVFINATLREELKFKLDTRGEIFQNLHGALDDVEIKFKGALSYLYNSKTGSQPLVVHGNGPIKPHFNSMTNYLGNAWTATMGCQHCKEDIISIEGLKDEDLPRVFIAIFLQHPTPFAEEFFEAINSINYPKERMDIFIHTCEFHEKDVTRFMTDQGMKYNSARLYGPDKGLNDNAGHNQAFEDCLKEDCQYLFTIDGEYHIENPEVLRHLIQTNRSVIAPFASRPQKLWSNFWGALSSDGYYKRSDDYHDIVTGVKNGIWNVPYIANAFLIHGFRVQELLGAYLTSDLDTDMRFAKACRDKNIFMYVDNQNYYGHLVDADNFETNHLNNDMYSILNNPVDWEKKYIHPDYHKVLADNYTIDQPCPDVYWSPIVTERFTEDLISEMEHFGDWSGGKNTDPRIAGGYENVPTVDIHMNQVGFEAQWLHFLKTYVGPVNRKIFTGYYPDCRSHMNFVVRYKPGEQDHLRPHHDASTFTINIALNRPGIDYEGGGVNFLRYNCTVTALRRGWMLMHPGRLTHLHEGLRTTGGTRYIMIAFIDP